VGLRIGDPAPTFTLPGTDGTDAGRRDYRLEEFRGRPVVVVFYPADHTPVCTEQLRTYTAQIADFDGVGAQVLAISPQSIESHEGFAREEGGFAFPLLADELREVGGAYGIIGPLGFYRRSAFVVDGAGVLRYAHRSTAGLTFRPTAELVAAVAAAG
jgi:peroxiredoxin Q/BCP